MNECHMNASCVNTQGSYNCSCYTTFIGNGFECKGTFGFLKKILNWMGLIGKERLFSAMPFFFLGLGLIRLLNNHSHIIKSVIIM